MPTMPNAAFRSTAFSNRHCTRARRRRRGLLDVAACAGHGADLSVVGREPRAANRRERARPSLGARLSARRPHAGDRAARPPAHRQPGRQAVAAGRRAAEGLRVAARADCSTSCLDRDFAQNQTIYFCFADPVSGGARTALASARLNDEAAAPRLDDLKVIFRQEGPPSRGLHFGCRIVQARDGNLFLTQGDHGSYRDEAQNLGNHLGKVIRIRPDGSVPPDNPFVNTRGRQAGDLELRPSQLAGRRAPSADRQAVGDRARSARRRRDQHSARRQELRLAGDRLRHRLQRREDPPEHAARRHGAAGLELGAVDRDLRHDVLHRRPVSGVARQRARRRAGRARRCRGSNSTARRS